MDITELISQAYDTKALEVGEGILPLIIGMFRSLFPGKRPIVVTDPITFGIVGQRVHNLFVEAEMNPDEPFIFDDPRVFAEWSFIERLDNALAATDAIPVAVGAGTINDIVKLSSEHVGKRYIIVATAASTDGYTAFGASVEKDGIKQTFNCKAPLGVIADTQIICQAPAPLTAGGYADLFAKITAGADWILADAMGEETLNEHLLNVMNEALELALSDPEAIRERKPEAIGNLILGLLIGGFVMQIYRTSRPASGADHLFSHLWNMEKHVMKSGRFPSHGFQVSIGTLTSLALYEKFLETDFQNFDIEKAVEEWPSLNQMLNETREEFKDADFTESVLKEVENKYISKDHVRQQLLKLKENGPRIQERIRKQIIPFDRARHMLAVVGAPVVSTQIGISKDHLYNSILQAQKIRKRFTILDLARHAALLDTWAHEVIREL